MPIHELETRLRIGRMKFGHKTGRVLDAGSVLFVPPDNDREVDDVISIRIISNQDVLIDYSFEDGRELA